MLQSDGQELIEMNHSLPSDLATKIHEQEPVLCRSFASTPITDSDCSAFICRLLGGTLPAHLITRSSRSSQIVSSIPHPNHSQITSIFHFLYSSRHGKPNQEGTTLCGPDEDRLNFPVVQFIGVHEGDVHQGDDGERRSSKDSISATFKCRSQ